MVRLNRSSWVEGAFEPALIFVSIVVVLGIAYVLWEFWLSDK